MTTSDVADVLAAHKTLGAAPRAELEWLAAHGVLRTYAAGDLITTKDSPIEGLFAVVSGRLAHFVDRGGGRHKAMEWGAGEVTGVLPYSRAVKSPGDSTFLEPSTIFVMPREHVNDLISECPAVTSILVHTMVDRARTFQSSDLLNEKLVSLGKLSAGLAHEMNNPVSAIERGASLLEDRLEDAEQAARALGAARLTDAQLAAMDAVRDSCKAKRMRGVRSPIQQAQREDAIADWLAAHNLDTRGADALADTAVTIEALDQIAAAVQGPALEAVLRWAAAGCAVRELTSEIQEAATRISGLVLAIKGFTHMDQAAVAEAVDVVKGIDNTVTVLRSKAHHKKASVFVEAAPGLPSVQGFAGELNQVWSNLIDNALDAIPEGGRVEVIASREGGRIVVRVVDDGPGIPAEARDRIFDPFFTTKPIGLGTGLGLDIVRRLVRHNDGDISFESRPGRTEFRVSLVASDAGAART